jgi:hypothetical protein
MKFMINEALAPLIPYPLKAYLTSLKLSIYNKYKLARVTPFLSKTAYIIIGR